MVNANGVVCLQEQGHTNPGLQVAVTAEIFMTASDTVFMSSQHGTCFMSPSWRV
jgi:hypothetical protein